MTNQLKAGYEGHQLLYHITQADQLFESGGDVADLNIADLGCERAIAQEN